MGMHNFRELKIWQRAMDLAVEVYKIVDAFFPKEEKYGLSSQVKKSAVSVPSNISEGAGRATNNQFRYFLEIAMGSNNELQTQLELARRFNYITQETTDKILDEAIQVYKMTLAFYNTLVPN
jgi:four helix bundle protein